MEIETASAATTRKVGDGRHKPQKAAAFIVGRIIRVSQLSPAKQVGKPSPWLLVRGKFDSLRLSIQEFIKENILPLVVSHARQLAGLHSILHQSLGKRIGWYASYHKWPKKRLIDGLVLGVYVMSMFGIIAVNISKSFAGDTDTSWDFAIPNHYVLDGGLEIGTNEARLSAQNYSDDPDTEALYHLDEPGGSIATDSSSYANDGNVSGGGFTAGNLNNAYSLSGPLDGIKVTDSAQNSLGQNHTIEGWTKLDEALSPGSTEQRQALADKGDYMVYYDNESGKLTYEIANPNYGVWTEAGDMIMNLLHSAKVNYGRTVILVTHNMEYLPLADHLLHIQDGVVEEIPDTNIREATDSLITNMRERISRLSKVKDGKIEVQDRQ